MICDVHGVEGCKSEGCQIWKEEGMGEESWEKDIFSYVHSLEKKVKQAEKDLETYKDIATCEISKWKSQHFDSCARAIKLEEKIKELENLFNGSEKINIKRTNEIVELKSRIKELEEETDRREKVFMEIVNKKSEQAGELQAVNELLKQAGSRIIVLEETRKKRNEEIIHFCNTMERMIDKIIKKEKL